VAISPAWQLPGGRDRVPISPPYRRHKASTQETFAKIHLSGEESIGNRKRLVQNLGIF